MGEMTGEKPAGQARLIQKIFDDESGVNQALGLGVWFGAWTDGRLGRLGYVAAALTLYGLLGVAQWFVMDALEPEPFQLTPVSQPMSETARWAILALSSALSLVTMVAGLNIAAKRIRAIGAPGWGGAIGLAVLNTAAVFAAPQLAYPWLALVVLIGLIVLPNGLLKPRAAG